MQDRQIKHAGSLLATCIRSEKNLQDRRNKKLHSGHPVSGKVGRPVSGQHRKCSYGKRFVTKIKRHVYTLGHGVTLLRTWRYVLGNGVTFC